MNFLPVIARELQAQARQPFTYWLRSLGLATLLGGAVFLLGEDLFEANLGGRLFGLMHLICYLAIWVLVPLSAADCISRERREGTLGLLFLTPLKPPHIVIAKGIAHGLRAWTLIVAVVPAMTIPFLLGGVTWQQAAVSAVVNFNAVCWCLAAALIASSFARSANRAMTLAVLFAFLGFSFFPWSVGALLGMNSQTTWTAGYSQSSYDFFVGFAVVAMPRGDFVSFLRFFKLAQVVWAIGMATAFSISALVFAVMFAGHRIRRSWREQPPSLRAQQMERVFCRPIIGVGLLRRWMRHKLERNPIGWLEQHRWHGRMVTWAWFAAMVSVLSLALTEQNFFRNSAEIQVWLACLLALSMAVTAAGSFRRERETGVLELLLVSPLTTRQIISGRLRGLWGQFLPSIVLLLGIWTYFLSIFQNIYYYDAKALSLIVFFAVSFLVIPVIGLYFSVRCRHFIGALLLTLTGVFVLPTALSMAVGLFEWLMGATANSVFDAVKAERVAFFQIFTGALLLSRLHQNLERRAFPLERPAS